MIEATLITVLRHGEVDGPAHVFRGWLDDPLSERGREQMRTVLAGLARPDRVATSPLQRCRELAAAYAGEHGLPLAVEPGFMELAFGEWEGLSADRVQASAPEALAAIQRQDADAAAPGGETLADFRGRVLAAWSGWLADADGGHRLLITHAGVMRVLLQHLLGLPDGAFYRVALPEAAHFQVSILPGHDPVLLNLNPCAASGSPSAS